MKDFRYPGQLLDYRPIGRRRRRRRRRIPGRPLKTLLERYSRKEDPIPFNGFTLKLVL
jgi:hypothetical protein